MSTITLKGTPIHTSGSLPALGNHAPDFILTKNDLSELRLKDYIGKNMVLNIFPSLDTGVCAASVRHFNKMANQLPNTVILCISADLPFAQKRFCGAENLTNVITASSFRHPEFGQHYGDTITDGPLAGLLARAVVLLDEKAKVIYTQQVPEITEEPDYEAVLKNLRVKV